MVVLFAASMPSYSQQLDNVNDEPEVIQAQLVNKPGQNAAQVRVAMVATTVKGIISYVRWPANTDRSQLCVVGPTEFADGLIDSSQTLEPNWESIKVRRVLLSDILADKALGCATVYVGKLDRVDQIALLQKLVGAPVLSISEDIPQCNNGSLFCLRIENDKVGFEVNLDSVARSGLRVNPQVLKLGRAASAN